MENLKHNDKQQQDKTAESDFRPRSFADFIEETHVYLAKTLDRLFEDRVKQMGLFGERFMLHEKIMRSLAEAGLEAKPEQVSVLVDDILIRQKIDPFLKLLNSNSQSASQVSSKCGAHRRRVPADGDIGRDHTQSDRVSN
ncbi:MAG: hypothetical protein ACXAB4_02355 [Candidatus Hodarchaeales archaeon]|jgi:hypothetical protein